MQLTPATVPEPWTRSMLRISENDSEDNESSQDTEYHSESRTELETGDYTLSNPDQRDTILHVWFPMPFTFTKPYLTLQEAIDNASDQERNPNIEEDPDEALRYIINHFNINVVTESIWQIPFYAFEQVNYSTYVETHWFTRLQYLISLSAKISRTMPLHNNG